MSQIGQFRIVDAGFKGNMERFVNQCVVYDAMIGQQYTLDDLQHTPDIWNLVTTKASPILGFLYKDGKNPGTIVTCREGAAKLSKLWAEQITKATAMYGSRVNNRTLTQSAFNTSLISSVNLLSSSLNFASSATDLLKQEMMINAIEEASNNKLSELGSASNYTATKALLQQRSAYAAAGEIAARTLPLFKNVIEALSYALFIFIVVLALLPNGYRTLLTYCGILAWTQLWAPLYAVLNLVMTLYGKHETMGHGLKDGLTLINSSAIINANADMVTLAAWLSVSIPFISYGILKQGAAAFVGLAQHLGSAMQSAASGAAAETVSGNISLGNVSMGTQAYQNTSAFQHNTSPSYTASQFRALSPAGIEQSTFGDGSQSLSTQALSRLSVQIMGTENTGYSQQQSLNEAQNMVQATSITAGQAIDAATQDTTNFLSQVGKAISSGTDRNQSVSASEAKTLQDFKNYVKDIQHSSGLNETQAMEAAVGASSGALQLLGIDIKGGFSSAAARQKAIQAADSVAKQTNYSDNLDKVVSAAQSFSESHTETGMKDLGKGVTSSLTKAKSLRDEVSVAQNQVKSLSNDISASQGKSLSITHDLTQSVLDFIAHQPINPGPHLMGANGESKGQIGYEGARHILENGGPERDAYLRRFQEENPQYHVQSINSAKEETKLSSAFASKSAQAAAHSGVMEQHAQNTANILAQGKEAQLDLNKIPESREKEITDSLNKQDGIIGYKKQSIDRYEKQLQDAEKKSKDQSLAGAMASNAITSLTPDMDATFQYLAETDPTYRQFVDQQKQEKSQILAKSSSQSLFQTGHEEEQFQPSSAFAAFKERLEKDGPASVKDVYDTTLALASHPSSLQGALQSSIKPAQNNQLYQKQETSETSKENSHLLPKLPLPPSNIRK